MRKSLLGLVAMSLVLGASCASAVRAADGEKKSDREALEKAFATKLSGASLNGSFSFDGKDGPNKPDKYKIVSAKKIAGDDWVVVSKTKVGDNEIDIPIPIKIYWADDTPVMSLTDLTIPGMGTFTARVMFYGDRYAGTWQHGEVGGQMWGKVEKASSKEAGDKDAKK